MPFEDPWLRAGKLGSPLDFERRMYEQTKNPIHVWRAYEICSDLMRGGVFGCDALPTWVLDHFDHIVEIVREFYYEVEFPGSSGHVAFAAEGDADVQKIER